MTAAAQTELRLKLRNLRNYINADPVTIQFVRYERIADGAGSWTKGPRVSVEPQIMRLVPYKRRLSTLTNHDMAGEIPDVQYSLVAMPGVDVQRWDEFEMNDAWYKVIAMEPKTRLSSSDRVTILIEIRDKDV